MSIFAQNFKKVLREADQINPERRAMEATLDDGIDPSEFDTDMTTATNSNVDQSSKDAADALSMKNQQIINELQGWIDNIEEFLSFLNSENPSSVQSRLAAAEPDTVMDKMKQSQQTKISRVAADLASLHQNFLGFMAQTANSRYKYIAVPLAFGLSMLGHLATNFFC